MFANLFNSFGIIPDIIRGKNPMDAARDNVLSGAMVGGAMLGAPAIGAAGAAGGAAEAAGTASAAPGLLSTIGQYAKPIGAAASAASSVKGLLDPQQSPIQTPMPMQQMGGAQTLAQLAGQNQQSTDQAMALAEQERAKRRQMFRGGLL